MVALNFDPSTVEPAQPFELLPPGEYVVQIVESDMINTKAGDGQMLSITMDILEGPHTGRKLWDNFNLVHPNETTVQIAQRAVSAICAAVCPGAKNSEQLHLKPLIAVVKTKPPGHIEKSGYVHQNGKNEVAGYKPVNGARPAATPAARVNTPPAAKPAAAAPPWRRQA